MRASDDPVVPYHIRDIVLMDSDHKVLKLDEEIHGFNATTFFQNNLRRLSALPMISGVAHTPVRSPYETPEHFMRRFLEVDMSLVTHSITNLRFIRSKETEFLLGDITFMGPQYYNWALEQADYGKRIVGPRLANTASFLHPTIITFDLMEPT